MINNRSNLEELPKETISDEDASHLDKEAIGRVRQTSWTMNRLFQEPSEAAKLLYFVQEANYPEAQKMVMANPLLATRYVSYIFTKIEKVKSGK